METDFERIDLRSDTVTCPTPEMRQAMCEAEVGDDMVGEDPTVNLLEAYCCELFQKEAAVFCCSGTQSNQVAVWSQCRPGDEILIEQNGHLANYEGGAPAVLSGVSVRCLPGRGGMLDSADLESAWRQPHQHFPTPKLLCLENTTNIGGGRVYPFEQLQRVCEWGRARGLRLHLDGARIFNACTAAGYLPHQVANLFDTVSLCFSKGLGCPMGSMLLGDADTIARGRRARKIFGGALRQAGIMAAAAVYALQHHRARLVEDHAHARRLAEILQGIEGVRIQPELVESNIVFFELDPAGMTGVEFTRQLQQKNVLMFAVGPQRIRAVTHLDINSGMVEQAGRVIAEVLARRP